jgi:hypothetical protein
MKMEGKENKEQASEGQREKMASKEDSLFLCMIVTYLALLVLRCIFFSQECYGVMMNSIEEKQCNAI